MNDYKIVYHQKLYTLFLFNTDASWERTGFNSTTQFRKDSTTACRVVHKLFSSGTILILLSVIDSNNKINILYQCRDVWSC